MASVLIVDDSQFQRTTISSILKKEGYEVIPAKGGMEGIELAVDKKPDIIVLDLLMPEFDGFEVLKELKQRSVEIPVLIVSADIQDTSRDMCRDLGAADFINKPINRDKLITAISRILESRD